MHFTELEAGKSPEGDPLKSYKTDGAGGPFLYLIAGFRGDEVEGVFILQKLFSYLQEAEQIPSIPIVLIPTLNIDGYRVQTPLNSMGVDLLENFPIEESNGHIEPENTYLLRLFKDYPPGLIINFRAKSSPEILAKDVDFPVAKFLAAYNQYPIIAPSQNQEKSLECYLAQRGIDHLQILFPSLSHKKDLQAIWAENETGLKKLFHSDLINCSL